MSNENYINHIALVLDASSSMNYSRVSDTVVKVADEQIKHLAMRSKENDQETRVTVYTFADKAKCLFYDKDVLRLPSLAGLYRANGNTALIDATILALDDLKKMPELYGDHSFLVYVLTDGQENVSIKQPSDLLGRLNSLPENWTVAAFVPDALGAMEAKKFGFTSNNISIWNTNQVGMREVGETIRRTTDVYMTSRSLGIRGTKNLFTPDTTNLRPSTVGQMSDVKRLTPGQFRMSTVDREEQIAHFVERQTSRPYMLGEGFYQLVTPVKVQPQKKVAIYDRLAHTVYVGDGARKLIGLPNYEVKVSPNSHPQYDIFMQSTSVNRKLLVGQKVLIVSPSLQ